ncbi:hypothetical protein [Limnoglobus roseus]|uniref:Uncharacterized protein n=1 Tax=Limnoglobus roseus TaxID=2598579 RepID=A0A5C1ANC9_9BACT|nr:hypothetical protein [Limnoglobus roseus]QEL20741.1 hypothetical protein PX52LOC_07851 [Limnoglobus roseus]
MRDILTPDAPTPAVRTKWVRAYSDFLLSVLGLRALLRTESHLGIAQQILADKAVVLLELADELNSVGLCPTMLFAGEEDALWQAAVRYGTANCWRVLLSGGAITDVLRAAEDCHLAWGAFRRAILSLPENFERTIPSLDPGFLRPDCLPWLFQAGVRPACRGRDEAGQPVAQHFDEPVHR